MMKAQVKVEAPSLVQTYYAHAWLNMSIAGSPEPPHKFPGNKLFILLVLFPCSKMQYSPEELLGMVLNYSRALAEEFAGWE